MRGAEPIFLPGAAHAAEIVVAGEPALCDRRGALFFPDLGLLCVSDLHLEKGSSLARRGMLVPPYDTAATLLRLQAVIDHYRPRIVVSLGDSFHDGEGASRLPDRMRLDLSAMMAGRDWFWVAGNHDPRPPAGLPGETVEALAVGSLVFRHEPSAKAPARRDRRPPASLREDRAARPLGAPPLLRDGRSAHRHAGLRRLYGFAERARPRLCRAVPS